MRYTVRILPLAVSDRRHISHYIEARSPQGAQRWEDAYEEALGRLEESPQTFGLAPESVHFQIKLRQVLAGTSGGGTYRAFYRVDDDQETIYRLRGPGQAPLSVDELSSD